jgi:hypothetical protein
MSKKTKVFEDEWEGKPMLAIHSVNEEGAKEYVKADIKFGIAKAKMLLGHMEEIKKFVEKNN